LARCEIEVVKHVFRALLRSSVIIVAAGGLSIAHGQGSLDRPTAAVTNPEFASSGVRHIVPFFPSASDTLGRQGVARLINHSHAAGEVTIVAFDDTGRPHGPLMLSIGADETVQFNSHDLEEGNADKLTSSTGPGKGDWRLELFSVLDIEVLSYIVTTDGLLAAMHDYVTAEDDRQVVMTFNPGKNRDQQSLLRLVNVDNVDAELSITGIDDKGRSPGEGVSVALPVGASRTFTAAELESGSGMEGSIGDGDGKWRLILETEQAIVAMSLLSTSSGHLTNLSTAPHNERYGDHLVPLFPSASDPNGRQGFLRVVNLSGEAGEVRVEAVDDRGRSYPPATLAIGAGETRHFNSDDLELGNPNKGLAGGTGAGVGDWRLALSSELEIQVLSYIRMDDGFMTAMHDTVPRRAIRHRVVVFNPGSNSEQQSLLRLVNPSFKPAAATIVGVDSNGESPGGVVRLTIPARSSRVLSAQELETGSDGFEGSLNDGEGNWRLTINADEPILAISLMSSATGRLANLSTAPQRGPGPLESGAELFELISHVIDRNNLEPQIYPQAADLDDDGDPDVIAVEQDWDEGTRIVWYENTDDAFSAETVIDEFPWDGFYPLPYFGTSVQVVDLDLDNDPDLLAVTEGYRLAWYENEGGGEFSTEQRIDIAFEPEHDDALIVQAADLDGDGDPDVVGAGPLAIWWWENEGGGEFSQKRVIRTDTETYVSVHAADLDGDGDADVVAGSDRGEIVCYANYAGVFSVQQVIAGDAKGPTTVHTGDLDGDGDPDLLAASEAGIAWYENDGTFAVRRTLTTANATVSDRGPVPLRSSSIHVADLDGDGDTDVLSAFESGVVWYENSALGFSPARAVARRPDPALSVHAADLDSDGDLDMLYASRGATAWYRNLSDRNDDHGDDLHLATTVTVLPAFLHGVLESPEDRDVFRMITGEGRLRITSNGPTDTFGSLQDAGGRQLDANDDDAPNSNFEVKAAVAAGPQYVEVRSARGSTGAYTVMIEFVAGDDHGDSRDVATPLPTLSRSVRGGLEHTNDRDVFQIDVPDGGIFTVRSSGSASRSIVLTDADGVVLATADDVIRADVADGTYYIEVRSAGGTVGEYSLSLSFVSRAARNVSFEAVEVHHWFDTVEDFLDVADLDGDGDPDLVYARHWHENQNGSFPRSSQRYGPGSPVHGLADLDNDGDTDLLWSGGHLTAHPVTFLGWHRNLGGGTFASQVVIVEHPLLGSNPFHAVDLDVDIDPDIAFWLPGGYRWVEHDGAGRFSSARFLIDNPDDTIRGAADLDGDGDPDLLAQRRGWWGWYENDGAPPFSAPRVVDETNLRSAQAADLDRDGDPDLLATIDQGIVWYENEGGGDYAAQRLITAARDYRFRVRAADVDGDHDLDIVSLQDRHRCDEFLFESYCYSDIILAWFENYRGRGFSPPHVIRSGSYGGWGVHTADLDSDGDADILLRYTGSEGDVYLTAFRNLSDHGDDHGDTLRTATYVPVMPAFLHGVVESPGDRDVFRVATGDGTLRAHITGPTKTTATILRSDGSEPYIQDGGADEIKADIISGTYYVEVQGTDGDVGPYTLSMSFARLRGPAAQHVTRTGPRADHTDPQTRPDGFGDPDAPLARPEVDGVVSTWTQRPDDTGPQPGTRAEMRHHLVGYLPAAWTSTAIGFVRVINHGDRGGELRIRATDDRGREFDVLPLRIGPRQALEFDAGALETGGAAGSGRGIGSGDGDWRLAIEGHPDAHLELEVMAYLRTPDGLLSPLDDVAAQMGNVHSLPSFALGASPGAEATLRVFNRRRADADVVIRGIDDQGRPSRVVHATVPAGEARSFTTTALETGRGVRGALGTAVGGWRLTVTSQQPIVVMGLLRSPTGHIVSLPSAWRNIPGEPDLIPTFTSAGDRRGQGVLRVTNHTARLDEVRISAVDDLGIRLGPLAVPLLPQATIKIDAADIEQGNPAKGIVGGLGTAATGSWWLEVASTADIEVVAYLRRDDGIIAPIHPGIRLASNAHSVGTFNPATSAPGGSILRMANPGTGAAVVTIRAIEDTGAAAGDDVTLTIPGGQARTLSALALQTGADADGNQSMQGALGKGDGPWRLLVTATQPILVSSTLVDGSGHMARSSEIPRGDARFCPGEPESAPE